MNYRNAEIAVEPRLVKRLSTAIKLYPTKCTRTITRDDFSKYTVPLTYHDLASEIINAHIAESFPKVLELEKQIDKLEKEMIQNGA